MNAAMNAILTAKPTNKKALATAKKAATVRKASVKVAASTARLTMQFADSRVTVFEGKGNLKNAIAAAKELAARSGKTILVSEYSEVGQLFFEVGFLGSVSQVLDFKPFVWAAAIMVEIYARNVQEAYTIAQNNVNYQGVEYLVKTKDVYARNGETVAAYL